MRVRHWLVATVAVIAIAVTAGAVIYAVTRPNGGCPPGTHLVLVMVKPLVMYCVSN